MATPPKRPTVEIFTPYTNQARVCATRYMDVDAHTDTEIKIWRVSPKTLITTYVAGAGVVAATIGAIALSAGELYRVRVRYENAAGWSAWSVNEYEKVPAPPAFTEIGIPLRVESAGLVPFNPSWAVPLSRRRQIVEKRFDTRHFQRRLLLEDERAVLQFAWVGVPLATFEVVKAFLLDDCVAAGCGFETEGDTLGDRLWVPRANSLETANVNVNAWSLSIECAEAEPDI